MMQIVDRGIRWLLQLDYAPNINELELNRHYGKTVDAFEIIEALEVLRALFKETARPSDEVARLGEISMIGSAMYRGEKDFDFIHDIKKSIKLMYLEGDTLKESALLNRKNRRLVTFLLNPIIDSFYDKTHEEALKLYDLVIDEVLDFIHEHETSVNEIDSMVVQKTITKVLERKNNVQHVVDGIMRLRRRKQRRLRKKAS